MLNIFKKYCLVLTAIVFFSNYSFANSGVEVINIGNSRHLVQNNSRMRNNIRVNEERTDVNFVPSVDNQNYKKKVKVPNFFYLGLKGSIGLTHFDKDLTDIFRGFNAGLRVMYFFIDNSKFGLIFDLQYENSRYSRVYDSYDPYDYYSYGPFVPEEHVNKLSSFSSNLMLGGMIKNFYFGAGGYFSYLFKTGHNFATDVRFNDFDAGFAFTFGYIFGKKQILYLVSELKLNSEL